MARSQPGSSQDKMSSSLLDLLPHTSASESAALASTPCRPIPLHTFPCTAGLPHPLLHCRHLGELLRVGHAVLHLLLQLGPADHDILPKYDLILACTEAKQGGKGPADVPPSSQSPNPPFAGITCCMPPSHHTDVVIVACYLNSRYSWFGKD